MSACIHACGQLEGTMPVVQTTRRISSLFAQSHILGLNSSQLTRKGQGTSQGLQEMGHELRRVGADRTRTIVVTM